MLTVPASKQRSYSRERKLQLLSTTMRRAATNIKLAAEGCLYQWLKNEKQIHEGSKGRKQVEGGGQKPFRTDAAEKLVADFMELQAKGLKLTHYRFRTRVVQQMSELHPDTEFKFSPGWFNRFKETQIISYWCSTTN